MPLPQTPLAAEDELALIPPISGGSSAADPEIHVRVTNEKLSVDALSRTVSRVSAGAIVIFCGVIRQVERLEYEAYREMALEKIALIASECIARHGLEAVAIEHRIGSVRLRAERNHRGLRTSFSSERNLSAGQSNPMPMKRDPARPRHARGANQ